MGQFYDLYIPRSRYYIPVRARAENIRMMLAYAGVEYDDHVVPMAEWRAPGGLKEKVAFGQLPAITLPGVSPQAI